MENEAMDISLDMDTLNKDSQKKGKIHEYNILRNLLFIRIIDIGIIFAET